MLSFSQTKEQISGLTFKNVFLKNLPILGLQSNRSESLCQVTSSNMSKNNFRFGVKTIWHNLPSAQFFSQKSLHPNLHGSHADHGATQYPAKYPPVWGWVDAPPPYLYSTVHHISELGTRFYFYSTVQHISELGTRFFNSTVQHISELGTRFYLVTLLLFTLFKTALCASNF